MIRKFIFVTPTTLLAAVAVKKSGNDSAKSPPETEAEFVHYNCKPSDLPLYAPLHSFNPPKRETHPPKNSAAREAMESGISVVRAEVQAGCSVLAEQKKHLDHYVDTAVAHSQSTIDYLNEPNNVAARGGAIAVGGLAGLVFGARGGFIKKLLYTSTGAGAVASFCYPVQAEHYAKEALFEARKGFAIAYNFVMGVKAGDENPIEPINKFPTSLQDLKFLMWDLYDDAKEALFGDKKK